MNKLIQLLFLITITGLIYSCNVFKNSSNSTKSIALTPKESFRGDAVFSLIVPDNNYGQIEDIHIYAWTQGGELNVNRVLIDFNFNTIPSTAIIDSAFLSLFYNPTSVYNKNIEQHGNDSIVICRVISDWQENSVTWRTQPKTTIQNQLTIGKFEEFGRNYENIDVTKIVEDIIESKQRFGILIRHKLEEPYNVEFFASSNHADRELHPRLVIYYRMPN